MTTVNAKSSRMKQFNKAFPECIFAPAPTEKKTKAAKKSKHPPKAKESDEDAFAEDEDIEIADAIGDEGVDDDADESDDDNFVGRRLASPVQADEEESDNTVASESDDNRAHGGRRGAGGNRNAPTRQLSNKQLIPKKNTSLSSPPGRGTKNRGFSLSSCFVFCLLFRTFISS